MSGATRSWTTANERVFATSQYCAVHACGIFSIYIKIKFDTAMVLVYLLVIFCVLYYVHLCNSFFANVREA